MIVNVDGETYDLSTSKGIETVSLAKLGYKLRATQERDSIRQMKRAIRTMTVELQDMEAYRLEMIGYERDLDAAILEAESLPGSWS